MVTGFSRGISIIMHTCVHTYGRYKRMNTHAYTTCVTLAHDVVEKTQHADS